MTLRELNKKTAEKEPWNFHKDGRPKKYVGSKIRMKCPQSEPMDEYGDAQSVANAVHQTLDWLRACKKRKWDTRPQNDAIDILELCQKGLIINDATFLHYDEDPERH